LTADAAAASKPIVVDHPPAAASDQAAAPSPAVAPTEPAAKPQEQKPSPSPKPTSTHPVTPEPSKDKSAPAPVREAKASETVSRAVPTEPGPGEYWQVVATSRPDAEIVTEALVKKGFRAMLAPAPKEGIFRVLVGPSADPASLAETRTKLEAAGFKNPMMRKY
jgi:cell division septation protein DedD